ncbi:hypothetical protein [Roseburia sp. AF42-8]|jgi:hypothetical protein|uniref:hypothetical protein n=1 Tax=Roseburia sp. AF42-8 TaxID=2293137 RepID=UPI000E430E34|nr:hypothetical protein [Roseburia sp. AF42-8]RGF45057.1 hypothetical protein DW059_05940 [Roseburia sp. AF42-8]
MNKLISDHEDEKVDELIGKVLNERAEKINVPDGMKEEIDERIGRTYTMRKNVNKKIGVYILTGIILIAVIIAITVITIGKKIPQSSEVSNPTFTDENGEVYVAAFLKGMTESTITVDLIEFITDDNEERIRELNIMEDDMPDGYYIYNPDEQTVVWELNMQTVYKFIDWNGDFTGSEYPEEYTTTDVQEFMKYVETYEDAAPGMPFFFQVEDGVVRLVLEKAIA